MSGEWESARRPPNVFSPPSPLQPLAALTLPGQVKRVPAGQSVTAATTRLQPPLQGLLSLLPMPPHLNRRRGTLERLLRSSGVEACGDTMGILSKHAKDGAQTANPYFHESISH